MMRREMMRRLAAEALGALLLAGTVIGSGIMASRLSGGDAAIALLANTAATAAILFALIAALAPVSGAHFNPAVTLAMALDGEIGAGAALAYVAAQVAGCVAGALLAHALFALPLLQVATQARAGAAQALSEAVATFTLVLVIFGARRHGTLAVASAVALTIAAGYWWTPSTSFANPAITIARALSDTFAGVRLVDVPGFLGGQIAGALAAFGAARTLFGRAMARA